GEAGSRLAHRLGMPTSGDTLLRLIRARPVATAAAPTIIGVDDWALKKRTRYGTIIVDLEHRRPIDLLPDRNAGTLAAWLQARPEISLVARDRSGEYRRAITTGAPSAVQVADRWHLLCNVRQMAERWAAGAYARLQRLPPTPIVGSPVTGRTKAFVRTRSAGEVAANSRARRQARYDEVREAGTGALARQHRTSTDVPTSKGQAALDTADRYAGNGHAHAPKRSYRPDWAHFGNWCQAHGFVELPPGSPAMKVA
ncbi:MAG: ISL3 family transposase, partial [Janthinobacterium lividum]